MGYKANDQDYLEQSFEHFLSAFTEESVEENRDTLEYAFYAGIANYVGLCGPMVCLDPKRIEVHEKVSMELEEKLEEIRESSP